MIRPWLLLGLVAAVPAASAQTMRTTSVARHLHGERELSARIDFASGALTLRPATGQTLYRMRLTYDADRFLPVSRYLAEGGQLVLGTESIGSSGLRVSSRRQLEQEAIVELSPRVALELDLTLGAVEAGLELGGLTLQEARIRTAASKTALRFSRPTEGQCRRLELNAGAAEFQAMQLGNSGCRVITFEGGVGNVTLDLSGAWPADARISARVAMGGLTLRLPRKVGIRLTADRFLAGFNSTGFVHRGDVYFSENYDQAARKLEIEISSTVGDINVEWVN